MGLGGNQPLTARIKAHNTGEDEEQSRAINALHYMLVSTGTPDVILGACVQCLSL